MFQLDPSSSFICYKLTSEELEQGSILNTLQERVIQNALAQAAEEKVAITFTPENIQREAELAGTLNAYRFLLELSKAAKAAQFQRIQKESGGSEPQ